MTGTFAGPIVTVSRLGRSSENLTEALECDVRKALDGAESAGLLVAQNESSLESDLSSGVALFDLTDCLSTISTIAAEGLLVGEDLARWAKKKDQSLAAEFLIQRLVLYSTLAFILGRKSSEIKLATTPKGKPYLPGSNLEFSISHTRTSLSNFLAIAWAHGSNRQTIGIDIEVMRATAQADQLAVRFFSRFENDELQRLAPSDRALRFFKLWSAKEAIVKALGSGMFEHMSQIELDFAPGSADAATGTQIERPLIRALPPEAGAIDQWQIENIWSDFLAARQMLGTVAIRRA